MARCESRAERSIAQDAYAAGTVPGLVTEPELLLCDEPTGNLDPDTSRATLDLLFAEAERRGTTIFFVTHDHGLLPRFDRTIDVSRFGAAP